MLLLVRTRRRLSLNYGYVLLGVVFNQLADDGFSSVYGLTARMSAALARVRVAPKASDNDTKLPSTS